MSAPISGIHPTALIGQPAEHREHRARNSSGLAFASVPHMVNVDSSALLEAFVTVDAGIHEPTTIGPRTWLMKHCHIGHDAQLGADCELAPGTVIGGHAILEDGVRCGIGVLVKPFVRVGEGARLGAGAVVVKDVPAGEVWVGNPAREIVKCQS
jgi:acyl-[acyl carrier protein]--UDP-N-acetylglucosamine O-acyltransferase